jgi:hypothetical protein
MPCYPSGSPEPVIYNRTINVHRFDDIVGTIYILIADYLYRDLLILVFLNVYGSYVLVDIFGEYSLQNDQSFVALTGLYYAQIIHLSVSVEIEVAECAVGVVEHRLELLEVFSFCKKLSYHLQVQSFRDVRTVGRNRHCLVCPQRCTHQHQRHQKCS